MLLCLFYHCFQDFDWLFEMTGNGHFLTDAVLNREPIKNSVLDIMAPIIID